MSLVSAEPGAASHSVFVRLHVRTDNPRVSLPNVAFWPQLDPFSGDKCQEEQTAS